MALTIQDGSTTETAEEAAERVQRRADMDFEMAMNRLDEKGREELWRLLGPGYLERHIDDDWFLPERFRMWFPQVAETLWDNHLNAEKNRVSYSYLREQFEKGRLP